MAEVLYSLRRLPTLSGKRLFSILQEESLFTPRQKNRSVLTTEESFPQNMVFNQERIIQDIETGLQDSSLLVIKGASGQGKTRTLQILQAWFDKVIFLDGSNFVSPSDILQAIFTKISWRGISKRSLRRARSFVCIVGKFNLVN